MSDKKKPKQHKASNYKYGGCMSNGWNNKKISTSLSHHSAALSSSGPSLEAGFPLCASRPRRAERLPWGHRTCRAPWQTNRHTFIWTGTAVRICFNHSKSHILCEQESPHVLWAGTCGLVMHSPLRTDKHQGCSGKLALQTDRSLLQLKK